MSAQADDKPLSPVEQWALDKLLAAMRGGIAYGQLVFPFIRGELGKVRIETCEAPPE